MSANLPSSLADGRYQLGALIGKGGMAEVHIAQDTRLGRVVAIKIMRSDLANDEIFLRRFAREAHSVAQMNNANIVNIYDSGEEMLTDENGVSERVPYLVMEYVKGQTLRDIIKANGPLSQRDTEQVMLGVLTALDYSHRMGIIHRDIKPGNIMISEQGIVKVMDFGIARALDDSVATMTQSQGVVGTAQYLSPEQARGETVDMRSDLYSAGCVLYEMLTGKAPFTGDSAVAIAYQHVSEVATPPSSLVPGLPRMWDQICGKAMAKDRQNRYATAAEFRNDILTFMNGGMPVAAAFNPLSDLSNMQARKQAEETAATEAMNPLETTATQAYNPLEYDPATGTMTGAANAAVKTRAEQDAAAKAKKKKKIIIGAVIGGLVALLAVVGVLFALSNAKKPQLVTVPSFSQTTTEARARKQLEKVGLKIKVEQDADSTEPEGTFTKQSPKGGAKAAKGSTVKVWFSTGPQSSTVPNVKGESQEQARAKLEKAGFKVTPSTQTEDSADVPKDMVTRTDPAAGSAATKGSSLMLYISSGMTQMPDVTGQSKDQAVQTLQSQKFTVTIDGTEHSDTVPKGNVIHTDPIAGASVAQQSGVTIYVSQGKEPVTVPQISIDGSSKLGDVKKLLQGFTVAVDGPNDDNALVIGMDLRPGSTVDKGTQITVTTKAPPSSSESHDSASTGGGDTNNANQQ